MAINERRPNPNEIVVGVDVGTSKVAVVVGKWAENDKISVIGAAMTDCKGAERGEITDVNATVRKVEEAVAKAAQQANVEVKSVHAGVGGAHIHYKVSNHIITNNHGGYISKQDVDRLTDEVYKFDASGERVILHVAPQYFEVDGQKNIKDPTGMEGLRLAGQFLVVKADAAPTRHVYTCFNHARLEVKDLIAQPIASAYSTLTEEEREAGVCLVDVGAGTTDVAIYADGLLRHLAVIPFGGAVVTKDVMRACGVTITAAEKLKTQYGAAVVTPRMEMERVAIAMGDAHPRREIHRTILVEAIRCRMWEIAAQVAKEIESAGFGRALPTGVVLTGGGSLLPAVADLFAEVTCCDVRLGRPTVLLGKGLIEEVSHPSYSTAIGLVAYGLRHAPSHKLPFANRKIEVETQGSRPSAVKSTETKGFLGKVKSFFDNTLKEAQDLID
ncbi:MAG: cell division protein FtsA [Bacteroidia bacterium]|nr:cell division protein FtsA [Bacteroidia bacterium]